MASLMNLTISTPMTVEITLLKKTASKCEISLFECVNRA